MTGIQSWKFAFGFQDDCSPIVTSVGNVIYGSDSGQLFALDFNGNQLWVSDMNAGPGEVDAALAESCNGIVFAGGRNGWTAMDAKSGSVLWQVAAGGTYAALMSSPLVSLDGTMYGLDSGGTAIAIDPTGKTKWSTSIGPAGAGTSLAKVGNTLFAVTNDGMLKAVDAASGTMKWSQPVNNAPETYRVGGPVVDGNERLWFNSNDGWLYAFDQTGKQVARIQHSGMPSAAGTCCDAEMAIGYDGTLYVPSNDGYLYAYQ